LLFCLVPFCFALLCSFTLHHTFFALMPLCIAPHLVVSFHDLSFHLALFHFKLRLCCSPSRLVVLISPIASPCPVTSFHALLLCFALPYYFALLKYLLQLPPPCCFDLHFALLLTLCQLVLPPFF
jgi:hypothetical protein